MFFTFLKEMMALNTQSLGCLKPLDAQEEVALCSGMQPGCFIFLTTFYFAELQKK